MTWSKPKWAATFNVQFPGAKTRARGSGLNPVRYQLLKMQNTNMWCNAPELRTVRLGPDPPHWQGRQEPAQKLSGTLTAENVAWGSLEWGGNLCCRIQYRGDGRLSMTETTEQPRTGVANTTNKNKPQKTLFVLVQTGISVWTDRVWTPGLIQAVCLQYDH